MANLNPTANISAGFTQGPGGVTTIIWGTSGLLRSPAPSSNTFAGEGFYTVLSVDQSEKAEQVYGENGTGIESWRVNLKHGSRWNVTVQDDSSMTPPTVGTSVSIVDMVNGFAHAYSAVVLSGDYRAARRAAGERVIQVENLTLVDSQTPTI
jgi:hypothetical protein